MGGGGGGAGSHVVVCVVGVALSLKVISSSRLVGQ